MFLVSRTSMPRSDTSTDSEPARPPPPPPLAALEADALSPLALAVVPLTRLLPPSAATCHANCARRYVRSAWLAWPPSTPFATEYKSAADTHVADTNCINKGVSRCHDHKTNRLKSFNGPKET